MNIQDIANCTAKVAKIPLKTTVNQSERPILVDTPPEDDVEADVLGAMLGVLPTVSEGPAPVGPLLAVPVPVSVVLPGPGPDSDPGTDEGGEEDRDEPPLPAGAEVLAVGGRGDSDKDETAVPLEFTHGDSTHCAKSWLSA